MPVTFSWETTREGFVLASISGPRVGSGFPKNRGRITLAGSLLEDFSGLRGERHMSLVTFRENGESVPTPIWFVEVSGRLFVRTASHFKKLQRIAGDSRVTVAPCTESGELTGSSVSGVACILAPEDGRVAVAEAALEAKYADVRPAMTKLLDNNGWTGVYVEIRPAGAG